LEADGAVAGYGSIAVAGPWAGRRTIFEFYVVAGYRLRVFEAFEALRRTTRATGIETQTNDVMLTTMLHTWAHDVASEAIVFEDKTATEHRLEGVALRKREREGDWLLVEAGGAVAGKGGVLYHYNRPYGDVWMEVEEPYRRRGFGAFLVQELKRICYEGGSIPCARCNTANTASRKTLQKAGFVPCAHILTGKL
jgi:GNAT superfamily N-acetyltransferase